MKVIYQKTFNSSKNTKYLQLLKCVDLLLFFFVFI